ncbi:MAG: RNA-binding S4 domain-containing protein [Clostridiales bacterium]|nr:RNA-binding S4 domain-containing protein [Clostridiales bacterium]
MRIDKFLKVARILKRRTVANDACSGGRVSVNGKDVKPSYKLKIGDIVELRFSSTVIKFKVKELREFAKKEEVESMYEFIGE